MPKWALDPLLNESTPLQGPGGGGEGHGAVNGSGANHDNGDSDGEYDSDFSEDDMARVGDCTLPVARLAVPEAVGALKELCHSDFGGLIAGCIELWGLAHTLSYFARSKRDDGKGSRAKYERTWQPKLPTDSTADDHEHVLICAPEHTPIVVHGTGWRSVTHCYLFCV